MMKHWNMKFVSSLVVVVALLGAVGEVYAIYGYDGTLQNMDDTDWVAGKEGNALDFDGIDDWVLSSYTNSFSTDHTWAAWIKTTGNGTIIAKAPQTGAWAQGGKCIYLRSGKVRYDVGWVGYVEAPTAVNNGAWHHVAVTVEFETSGTSDTATIYIDGTPVASKNNWNVNTFSDSGLVLKVGDAGDNFGNHFAGLIDEVRVYDKVLSQSEIANISVRPPDPVVYYEFNESSGSTAFDSSVGGDLPVIDDFDYSDTAELLQSWEDGASNGTGASALLAEQAMQISYDNTNPVYYSQLRYAVPDGVWDADLTLVGLSLLVYGDASNAQEPFYVALEDGTGNFGLLFNGIDTKDTIDLTLPAWQELNVPLQDFVDQGVVISDIQWLYIGFGNPYTPEAGGQGQVLLDSIRLYPSRCVEQYKPIADINDDCVVDLQDFAEFAEQWLD